MDSSSNVGILSMNIDNNRAGIGIKADIRMGKSNFSSNLSGNLFEVYLSAIDTDLSEQNNHSCFDCGFHGTFSVWINLKNGIKNTI